MAGHSRNLSHLADLPTEIIYHIFSFLPAKRLIRCREVCTRWKQIIDELFQNESIWRRYCKTDFASVFNEARRKARPDVSYYDLYKSLSLWPRLKFANEEFDEFASASSVLNEILGFEVLKNGIVGVRTKESIVYYNFVTLEPADRGGLFGQYLEYKESDTLTVLNNLLHLFILRKEKHSPRQKTEARIDEVKLVMLLENKVFYVNVDEEIYECDLSSKNMNMTFLQRANESVVCLGHINNHLCILTFYRNVYKVTKSSYKLIHNMAATSNILNLLNKYHFIENMEWRTYYQWMFMMNHSMPDGPLRFISVIRSYGDVYFVGTDWGLLRIYYAPFINGRLDLFNSRPLKQFNFSKPSDCPVLSDSTIVEIGVSEAKNGHTVLVGMPKKIAVINFTHNFTVSTSVAVLPFFDKLKISK